jgi:uncharacterized protein YndB with AHSA1/START domain
MVPERIEREILIDAPLEVVWSVLTEPEHVSGWFSDSADIDLRPGGQAILTWEEHDTVHWRVERVDPPTFFSVHWVRAPGSELREGNSTLVEFSLSAEGDGTRLRVVESGFPELDGSEKEKSDDFEAHTRGWRLELDEMSEYVSKLARGQARR